MVMVKVVSNVVKATNRDEGVYWRDNVGRKVEATTASEGGFTCVCPSTRRRRLPPPRSKAAAAAVRLPGRGRGVVVAYCSRRLLSSGQSTQYHHFAPPAHPPKAHTPLLETARG